MGDRWFQRVTGSYMGLRGVKRGYRRLQVLQGVIGAYNRLQGVTWCYEGLQGVTGD